MNKKIEWHKCKCSTYAKKLTSSVQVSVEALSFDLHMVKVGEVPY
jgi:hypothetical protein